MDYDKLKESGRKIRMPDGMKNRIKKKCVEYEAPEDASKPSVGFNRRLVAVCACCLFVLLGIVLKHSGVFDKTISRHPDNTSQATQIPAFVQTPSSTMKQIVATTVKVLQNDRPTSVLTTRSSTTAESETTIQQTESFTENEQLATEEYIVQEVPPSTLYMDDLSVLKDAKRAAETMSFEDYHQYLNEKESENYRYFLLLDCFYYPEEYLEFCESELYVPVVNEEKLSVLWMDMNYVPSYELIDMVVSFDETDKFRFYVDTSGDFRFRINDDKKYKYVETASFGNATAEIYQKKTIYQINDYLNDNMWWGGIRAEITVDGQQINLLSTVEVTLEEFKEYLKCVDFIKIKDWI